ncbi:MAG: hypothetical protein LC778_10300 [Acidobacteria bacterium]|nr:hypothetical protein [Acidobacteriota bacterium]
MMIVPAKTREVTIEYVLLTQENLPDAAKWCEGWVRANNFIEFENIYGRIVKAAINMYIAKWPSGKFLLMLPQEFELYFTSVGV